MSGLMVCDHCGRRTAFVTDMKEDWVEVGCSGCGYRTKWKAEADDTEPTEVAFCFRCGYEVNSSGECVNPYCSENPQFGDEGDGPQ